MPDIVHNFPINGSTSIVFEAITSPQGLDSWWSKACAATPGPHAEYQFNFGPGHDWLAQVTRWDLDKEFELQFNKADADWTGSRINFRLTNRNGQTEVLFSHTGWPEANQHYQISCFCWAMYLRLLKRFVEFGEVVPYESRLDV